ncbi:MAG: hypothetical protein HOE90_02735 [Bacteriovoracaceae bacterium]|jgi:hypothetical protein|nr:hypothetical protein [Bacteriovoracaceae bacterium]
MKFKLVFAVMMMTAFNVYAEDTCQLPTGAVKTINYTEVGAMYTPSFKLEASSDCKSLKFSMPDTPVGHSVDCALGSIYCTDYKFYKSEAEAKDQDFPLAYKLSTGEIMLLKKNTFGGTDTTILYSSPGSDEMIALFGMGGMGMMGMEMGRYGFDMDSPYMGGFNDDTSDGSARDMGETDCFYCTVYSGPAAEEVPAAEAPAPDETLDGGASSE